MLLSDVRNVGDELGIKISYSIDFLSGCKSLMAIPHMGEGRPEGNVNEIIFSIPEADWIVRVRAPDNIFGLTKLLQVGRKYCRDWSSVDRTLFEIDNPAKSTSAPETEFGRQVMPDSGMTMMWVCKDPNTSKVVWNVPDGVLSAQKSASAELWYTKEQLPQYNGGWIMEDTYLETDGTMSRVFTQAIVDGQRYSKYKPVELLDSLKNYLER